MFGHFDLQHAGQAGEGSRTQLRLGQARGDGCGQLGGRADVDHLDLHAAREKNIVVTNTPGVLDKAGALLTNLSAREIDELFADGTISGGMLPKIASALDAAKSGVNAVHIIDGRVPHVLLLEILTEQAFGTMIRSS